MQSSHYSLCPLWCLKASISFQDCYSLHCYLFSRLLGFCNCNPILSVWMDFVTSDLTRHGICPCQECLIHCSSGLEGERLWIFLGRFACTCKPFWCKPHFIPKEETWGGKNGAHNNGKKDVSDTHAGRNYKGSVMLQNFRNQMPTQKAKIMGKNGIKCRPTINLTSSFWQMKWNDLLKFLLFCHKIFATLLSKLHNRRRKIDCNGWRFRLSHTPPSGHLVNFLVWQWKKKRGVKWSDLGVREMRVKIVIVCVFSINLPSPRIVRRYW